MSGNSCGRGSGDGWSGGGIGRGRWCGLNCIVLYCGLNWIVLDRIGLYCIVLDCLVLNWFGLDWIELD